MELCSKKPTAKLTATQGGIVFLRICPHGLLVIRVSNIDFVMDHFLLCQNPHLLRRWTLRPLPRHILRYGFGVLMLDLKSLASKSLRPPPLYEKSGFSIYCVGCRCDRRRWHSGKLRHEAFDSHHPEPRCIDHALVVFRVNTGCLLKYLEHLVVFEEGKLSRQVTQL